VRNKRRLKPAATFLTTFIEIPKQELSAFAANLVLNNEQQKYIKAMPQKL
jgi:hypothetical protein